MTKNNERLVKIINYTDKMVIVTITLPNSHKNPGVHFFFVLFLSLMRAIIYKNDVIVIKKN